MFQRPRPFRQFLSDVVVAPSTSEHGGDDVFDPAELRHVQHVARVARHRFRRLGRFELFVCDAEFRRIFAVQIHFHVQRTMEKIREHRHRFQIRRFGAADRKDAGIFNEVNVILFHVMFEFFLVQRPFANPFYKRMFQVRFPNWFHSLPKSVRKLNAHRYILPLLVVSHHERDGMLIASPTKKPPSAKEGGLVLRRKWHANATLLTAFLALALTRSSSKGWDRNLTCPSQHYCTPKWFEICNLPSLYSKFCNKQVDFPFL